MISRSLILFVALSPPLFAVTHILICRRRKANAARERSPQRFLVGMELLFNGFVLAGVTGIGTFKHWNADQWSGAFLFAFLYFNGMSYAYFHWFNLSETGRRVRMIVEISRTAKFDVRKLEDVYSAQNMILERLRRLEISRQILLGSDGRYRVKSRLLLRVAAALRSLSRFLRLGSQADRAVPDPQRANS